MRIQGLGEGLGEARNEFFGIAFDYPHRLQLVAVNLLLLGLVQVNAHQQGVFDLELHDLSQELMLFRRRLQIGALVHVSVQRHRFVESVARAQKPSDNGLVLTRPRYEQVINLLQRGTVARLHAYKHAL
ncbi:MAG TPA: hypothetical protein VJZ49_05980 [Syntrophales bacterium]|nr:hypothetical protein [Syntrophales bacterium]